MKVVFGLGFAVCFVLIFNFVNGEFELDPHRSPEANTLVQKRYTPRKRFSNDAFDQENTWDLLTEKRYTPRKRLSDELNNNDNLWELYKAQKRFTPRKRQTDQNFEEDNTYKLLAEKRFIPRAVKRIAEVLEQPQNEALEQYLTQTLEKRFTPRKRAESEDLEEDDALKLFAHKRFTPRKRLSDGLTEQEDGTMDQYTDQRTQKRYTPRKRLSPRLDEQGDIWKEYVPEDMQKRFTPRRSE